MSKKSNALVYRSGQILFAVLAIAIGCYPAFYFFSEKFGILNSKSGELLDSIAWNSAFYLHITCGGLALLIGWVQFVKKIRLERVAVHRSVGKMYVLLALVSAASAGYLAIHANGGLIAVFGFLFLAIIWFVSTYMGFTSIRNGQIVKHQQLMIFSYAACFAAVTLRLWLPLLISVFNDFSKAYAVVSWLCWVPNMVVAYLLAKSAKEPELQV